MTDALCWKWVQRSTSSRLANARLRDPCRGNGISASSSTNTSENSSSPALEAPSKIIVSVVDPSVSGPLGDSSTTSTLVLGVPPTRGSKCGALLASALLPSEPSDNGNTSTPPSMCLTAKSIAGDVVACDPPKHTRNLFDLSNCSTTCATRL